MPRITGTVVRYAGYTVPWHWEVYFNDERTVIAAGEEFTQQNAFEACEMAVVGARLWWTFGRVDVTAKKYRRTIVIAA